MWQSADQGGNCGRESTEQRVEAAERNCPPGPYPAGLGLFDLVEM